MAVQRVEELDYPAVVAESSSALEQELESLPRADARGCSCGGGR
jgi:hypothetical protein